MSRGMAGLLHSVRIVGVLAKEGICGKGKAAEGYGKAKGSSRCFGLFCDWMYLRSMRVRRCSTGNRLMHE